MSRIRYIIYLLGLTILLSGQAFAFVEPCSDDMPHPMTMEMDHSAGKGMHQDHNQDHEVASMPGTGRNMDSMGHVKGPCCDLECNDCDMSHYSPQVTTSSEFTVLNLSSQSQFMATLELSSSPNTPFKPPIFS